MAKRASQAGDARTTDRTSARRLGTELSACGKRRRWTAEQKLKIVAEGMQPDVSAAMVAGRHGISTGQFYAWRQQLLLRRALDAGADSVPNLAGIEATTSAPRVEPAMSKPPEPCTPTAAAAPVAPVQPDDRVGATRPDGVAGRSDEDFGVEHAATTDRRSVLNSPLAARADCGQADRSVDPARPGAMVFALRRFCQRNVSTTLIQRGSQFKLCGSALVHWLYGVEACSAFVAKLLPFKVRPIVVLGFRIALRNGSQWSRSMRRRAAGGGDCRYA